MNDLKIKKYGNFIMFFKRKIILIVSDSFQSAVVICIHFCYTLIKLLK